MTNRSSSVEVTSSSSISHSSFKDGSPILWFCISAAVCLVLFFIALSIGTANQDHQRTAVNVYCASAVVEPMTKIVDRFNSSDFAHSENLNVKITRTGGSGALAGQLSAEALTGVQNMGDIFVCADSTRMSNLITETAMTEAFPIATQFPVIAVRSQTNFKFRQVSGLKSLLNSDIKLGIGSVSSAIGFKTRQIAKANQCLDLLENRKTADFENVMSLAQALSIGSIDAAIIWDSTVHQCNQTGNQAIKILAYLRFDIVESESTSRNPPQNAASSELNLFFAKSFGKFSDPEAPDSKSGCSIEVGRSKSVSPPADLFFRFLNDNRDKVSSDFVDAGFSILPLESSLNDGQESNQP